MPTPKQIAANRLNAQKSTGPRTPRGKKSVSKNALRHGLRCTKLATKTLQPDPYHKAILKALLKENRPQTPAELQLLKTCAHADAMRNQILTLQTESIKFELSNQQDPEILNGPQELRLHMAMRDSMDRPHAKQPKGQIKFDLLLRYDNHYERVFMRAMKNFLKLQHERKQTEAKTPAQNQQTQLQKNRKPFTFSRLPALPGLSVTFAPDAPTPLPNAHEKPTAQVGTATSSAPTSFPSPPPTPRNAAGSPHLAQPKPAPKPDSNPSHPSTPTRSEATPLGPYTHRENTVHKKSINSNSHNPLQKLPHPEKSRTPLSQTEHDLKILKRPISNVRTT